MKTVLALALTLGFSSAALADDFGCSLRMANGDYREATSEEYRGRTAIVQLNGYTCTASRNDTDVRAYLYEPGETDDDDATKSQASLRTGVTIERADLGVTCTCGMR